MCNFISEKLKNDGKITQADIQEHLKNCPECQKEKKKLLESIEGSINVTEGWVKPKCPYCYEDIEPEMDIKECSCGSIYCLDISCENEVFEDLYEYLQKNKNRKIEDAYIMHNYSKSRGGYNIYLTEVYDIITGDDLCHLVVCK